MASHAWFIEQLERDRATFEDNAYPLPKYQSDAFQLCCELLREDATSLAKRSKQRRSVRLRARTLLVDVFTGLGCEMFLLCTLATNISTLATIPIKDLVPTLRRWWKGVSHPNGLTETANKVCEANSISALIPPSTKRSISETDKTVSSPTRRIRSSESRSPGFAVQQHHDTVSDLGDALPGQPLQPQFTNSTIEKGLAQTESTHSQNARNPPDAPSNAPSSAKIPSWPAHQPDESVIDFKLKDLFAFLQQYEASSPNLRMRCPWDGIPLPSINIEIESSSGLSSNIELSHELGARFLEYILVSRGAAAKVPH